LNWDASRPAHRPGSTAIRLTIPSARFSPATNRRCRFRTSRKN